MAIFDPWSVVVVPFPFVDRRETKRRPAVVQEFHRQIADLVRRSLTETERRVVTLYYYEQLTLLEVGRVLGVSESRVSQIHTKIVKRLKKLFA